MTEAARHAALTRWLSCYSCTFSDCQHLHEPGCVVRGDWQRYPFYVEMRAEVRCPQRTKPSSSNYTAIAPCQTVSLCLHFLSVVTHMQSLCSGGACCITRAQHKRRTADGVDL